MRIGKKFYIGLISSLLACACLLSIPDMLGKYKKYTQGNAFRIQFPVLPDEQLNIMNQFIKILNGEECDVTINGVKYTDSYEALIAAFNNSTYGSNGLTLHNNSYIGSMQPDNANGTGDAEALKTLFGDVLENETSANSNYSLMLKREPIDGDVTTGEGYYMSGDHGWKEENQYYQGAEMILFSTSDNLNVATYTKVTVYATVFTKYPKLDGSGNPIQKTNADGKKLYHDALGKEVTEDTGIYPIYETGEWVTIGSYTGYAEAVAYSGDSGVGSFNTGTWRSTEIYGTARLGSTLQEVVQATNP